MDPTITKHVCASLFLHLLILQGIQLGYANELDHQKWSKIAKQTTNDVLQLHSVDDVQTHEVHTHSTSHMMNHHLDPSIVVFFLLDDLKLSHKLPVFFPDRDLPSPASPQSLSRQDADSIPFSLNHLPDLLRRFSFSPGSPQAIAMEDTLRECEVKPIKGEIKLCATSYGSMINFADQILGSEANIKIVSTIHHSKPTSGIQEYTIVEVPRLIPGQKKIACHTMPYPYTIFYCHYQESESRVYKVSLQGENGDRVEALAVCHMDTSQWNPSHIAFSVLGIGPGDSPVCHFFPADNFVLVSLSSNNTSST